MWALWTWPWRLPTCCSFPSRSFSSSQFHRQLRCEHFLPFSGALFSPLECALTQVLLSSSSPLSLTLPVAFFYIFFPSFTALALAVLSWMLDLCMSVSSFRAQVKVKCRLPPFVIRFDLCKIWFRPLIYLPELYWVLLWWTWHSAAYQGCPNE